MAKQKLSKSVDNSPSRKTQAIRTARNKHNAAARVLRRKREKPQRADWKHRSAGYERWHPVVTTTTT